MGLFAMFRRRPPIRDIPALADFLDQQSSFLTQKGIYEYARARAGMHATMLFREALFLDAVENSRWRAYPLGLAMVGEMIEGALRPFGDDQERRRETLCALTLSVFDRYPVPAPLGAQAWGEARGELARRLRLIGLHPGKHAKDIPEPLAQAYFELMPIHAKLRSGDFVVVRNYLRVAMCNIHDEFTKRADAPALVQALRMAAPQ